MLAPWKVWRPVNISYSTQPNAQMSVRRSTSSPRACSGLMYIALPRMLPAPVAPAVAVVAMAVRAMRGAVAVGAVAGSTPRSASRRTLAMPKSSTFTIPVAVSMMFRGLRSR
jgi:hypothetical protein